MTHILVRGRRVFFGESSLSCVQGGVAAHSLSHSQSHTRGTSRDSDISRVGYPYRTDYGSGYRARGACGFQFHTAIPYCTSVPRK